MYNWVPSLIIQGSKTDREEGTHRALKIVICEEIGLTAFNPIMHTHSRGIF